MTPLKSFKEFLSRGIVRKITPDLARARSLTQESKKRKKFLEELHEKIGLKNENANYFIENSYDLLIELLRARLLVQGLYASGEGAHEAEVTYMQKLGFPEKDIRFMNSLRYFRNGILYHGKSFDKEYGEKVLKFLEKTYPKLKGHYN